MKKYSYLFVSGAFLLAFIIFTIIFKTVDVQYIYGNRYLGLYMLNYNFGNWATQFGKYESMTKLSDILLYISFGYVGVIAILGIIHLIKVKSFAKVNKGFYLLLGAYVLVVIIYVVFEIAKLNYAPDITDGLKASYPSTHVFVGCTFFLINTFASIKMLNPEKKWVVTVAYVGALLLCVLLTYTRAMSLKHWMSDIIASVLLIGIIYFLFVFVYNRLILGKEVIEKVD